VSAKLAKMQEMRSPLSGNPISPAAVATPPAAIVAHALRRPAAAPQQPLPDAGAGITEAAVVERQVVPGYGTFTAFVDGRVCVSYEDRTLLKLTPDGQQFEALLPSGQLVRAPLAQPAELQAHVASAVEFAAWSAATPKERALPMERQRCVQAQLGSNQRLLTLLGPHAPASSGSAAALTGTGEAWPQRWPPCQPEGCSEDACRGAPGAGCAGQIACTGHLRSYGEGASWDGGAGALWQAAASEAAACGSTDCTNCAVMQRGSAQEDDYMLELVSNGSLRARGSMEREAVVKAWLRRNSLLLDRL
jgi:hypothetical protein